MSSDRDIEQKREALKGAYVGPGWLKKVKAMKPNQVTAVYLRLKAQGRI